MELFRKYLVLFLLGAISFFSVPGEIFHAFSDHDDTSHVFYSSGVHLEEEHTHCSYLSFESADYIIPDEVNLPGSTFISFETYKTTSGTVSISSPEFFFLRAPPFLSVS